MKRRLFLSSGSAAAAMALVGCGGGGGGGAAPTASTGGSSPTGDLPLGVQTGGQTASSSSGTGYAFGSRQSAYVAGIKPSAGNAAMDGALKQGYDNWKSKRVIKADMVTAGGYAVTFSDPTFMHVSEGMGYGMLLAVVFAGHDPGAKELFDGLLAVARTRYAYGNASVNPLGKYLMDWRLYANGSSGGEGWNAVDGDLDMAMALLMADRQWGSGGKWNYKEEAKNTINAIKECCMRPDGTTRGLRLPHVSRTSDYMIGHFRAFRAATGDSFWDMAINRAFELTELMQTKYSPGVGLMPDFVVYTDTANPIPSPGYMGDGNENEDKFWWNGCRNPWRFATDYLLHGDARSRPTSRPRKPGTARRCRRPRRSARGTPGCCRR